MKTKEEHFIDEEPEGRLFAVIIGLGVLIIGGLICGAVVWSVGCGIAKLIELLTR